MKGKKRERIIRVLLTHPDQTLTKYRIAKEAECSHVWVLKYLHKLEQRNLVTGTDITDVKGLFLYWLEINTIPVSRQYNVQNPLDLLDNTELHYALTTYYAENLVHDYLFPSRVDIYIEKNDLPRWHTMLTERGLAGKGNVRLLGDDHHVFYATKTVQGYRTVSIPQLILDLLREEGVAKEAAYMLMEKHYDATVF